jgi:hypothetical protein
LSVVRESIGGAKAGRLVPGRRRAMLMSTARSEDAGVTNLTGYVKARKRGQRIKVQVRETSATGHVIGRRTMWFRSRTAAWQRTPVLSFRASAKDGARLSVRIRPVGRRPGRLIVDAVKLVPGS